VRLTTGQSVNEYAFVARALDNVREWQFCLDALYTRKHTIRRPR